MYQGLREGPEKVLAGKELGQQLGLDDYLAVASRLKIWPYVHPEQPWSWPSKHQAQSTIDYCASA